MSLHMRLMQRGGCLTLASLPENEVSLSMQVMNIIIYGLKSVAAKAATAAMVPTPLHGSTSHSWGRPVSLKSVNLSESLSADFCWVKCNVPSSHFPISPFPHFSFPSAFHSIFHSTVHSIFQFALNTTQQNRGMNVPVRHEVSHLVIIRIIRKFNTQLRMT